MGGSWARVGPRNAAKHRKTNGMTQTAESPGVHPLFLGAASIWGLVGVGRGLVKHVSAAASLRNGWVWYGSVGGLVGISYGSGGVGRTLEEQWRSGKVLGVDWGLVGIW